MSKRTHAERGGEIPASLVFLDYFQLQRQEILALEAAQAACGVDLA